MSYRRPSTFLNLMPAFAASLLSLTFLTANGQEPAPTPGGNTGPTPSPTQPPTPGGTTNPVDETQHSLTLDATKFCPLYPFMLHNGYTSYYAMRWTSANKCTSPFCYTGPNNLPVGNCVTGVGCPESTLAPAATSSQRNAINQFSEEIRRDGYTDQSDIQLAPGVQRLHDNIRVIEFNKDPNGGGPVLKAKVVLGYLTQNQVTMAAGVGTGLPAGDATASNRSAANSEVITLERDRHVVRVLVQMTQSEWREYSIILPNGTGN